jgi:hypothetical protein
MELSKFSERKIYKKFNNLKNTFSVLIFEQIRFQIIESKH